MVVFPLQTATKDKMAKNKKKRNCNYKNYNHYKHRNCSGNDKRADIEVTVGQHKVLDYAPSLLDKSLTKTVKLCYSPNLEHMVNTDPIVFDHIDFNFRQGTESTMTLYFANEHNFWVEMGEKVMPIISSEDLEQEPFFVVEVFNGTELICVYDIFPNKIGVMLDRTLVVDYSTSCVMSTEKI